MSTAQARAEARRKAILSRGTDRLSKLTNSARGEDATYINTGTWNLVFRPRGCSDGFLHVEPSITPKTVTSNTFVGEDPPELPLPSQPQPRSVSGSTNRPRADILNDLANVPPIDPSVWSEAQQEQFMRALGLGLDRGSGEPPLVAGGPPQQAQRAASEEPTMDLLSALMAAQQQRPGSPGSTTAFSDASPPFPTTPRPRTKFQKLLPLIHVVLVWCLFAFFAVWREPAVHGENSPWKGEENSFWARWARLLPPSSRTPGETWQVQPVVRSYPHSGTPSDFDFILALLGSTGHVGTRPVLLPDLFWICRLFPSRILLHRSHLESQDPISPPTVLSMALPILTPQLRSIVLNGLRYYQMFAVLLDDVAAALISVGLFVYLSTWLVN